MGIISSAAGAGLGQGIANLGGFLIQDQARDEARAERLQFERERLAQARELALEKIAASRSGGGKGGDPLEQQLGTIDSSNYGFNFKPTDPSKFMTVAQSQAVQDPVSTGGGQYTDAISRKGAIIESSMGLDEAGYAAAEKRRGDDNLDRRTRALTPAAYESYQKGMQEAVVTRLTSVLERTSDPKTREMLMGQIAEVTNATTDGVRFKVEGDQKLNVGTGASTQTDLGNAKAADERAGAKKAGAEIDKIKAEIDGGGFDKNSRDRLTTIVNSSNATIKSLNEGSKGRTPEEKASWQRQMDDAIALRDKANGLLSAKLSGEPDKKDGKPAISNVKDNPAAAGALPAPTSAAERNALKPGTRYKAPDGSIRIR